MWKKKNDVQILHLWVNRKLSNQNEERKDVKIKTKNAPVQR